MKHTVVYVSILTAIEKELKSQNIEVNDIETIILKQNHMRIYDKYSHRVDYELKLIPDETCSTTT